MSTQVWARRCTPQQIMKHPNFVRGFNDRRQGKPFDWSLDDDYWAYDRGRLFACIAPLSMDLWNGKQLNVKAVNLFKAAYKRKLIL